MVSYTSGPSARWRALIAIVPVAGLLLVACERQEDEPNPSASASDTPSAPTIPALPAALPALDRELLVRSAGQAASAYAAGEKLQGPDPLVGRTFAVRIAFGCDGSRPEEVDAEPAEGFASWSWNRDRKSIEIRMTPANWAELPLIIQTGGKDGWEAVEGFWLPRPWLASESCPAIKNTSAEDAPSVSPQTVGLAAVFEAGGSRIGRRNGRPYRFTLRTEDPPPKGYYRLLLEGRVAAFPDGRAIACRASGPDQRPVCIIAAKLDRVAFEDSEGKTLSEW